MKQPTDQWWVALEAERHDQTWKQPRAKYAPTCSLNHNVPKNEAELWFHAGRYNEGARDIHAVRGNRYAKGVVKP